MKKLIAAVLAAVLLFALTACGQNSNEKVEAGKPEEEKLVGAWEKAESPVVTGELKDLIENAEIVDHLEAEGPRDTVTLGSIVRVRDVEFDDTEIFEIVGSQEANPRNGRISDDSPVGNALKGHRVGDVINVEAPAGVLKFEIISIENR